MLMSLFYFYKKALLYTIKLVALLIAAAGGLIFVLILCDQLIGLDWGYPLWSAPVDLGLIAIALAVRHVVTTCHATHGKGVTRRIPANSDGTILGR